jgi:ubiquitin-protein ligase
VLQQQEAFTRPEGTHKVMHQTPRIRRLHNDLAALDRLRSESSVFRFTFTGDPPQQYHITFAGQSLWRDHGKYRILERHRVEIKLGASYPRSMPEIRWLTPIFHPNISEIGMVCLGGYGTHWVPSVQLDELCVMLWDMARFHNYDIRSPYNRECALWVASQSTFRFPIDSRPLRDLRALQGRVSSPGEHTAANSASRESGRNRAVHSKSGSTTPVARVLQFIERYGRGSNGVSAREQERRDFNEVMARMYPDAPRVLRSTQRSSTSPANVEVPELARGQVGPELTDSSADRAALAMTPPETDQASSDGDQNDVMILEASPDDIGHERARPADDEVLFID